MTVKNHGGMLFVKSDRWPAPMEPANLRVHFETTYRLDDSQVEVMLESSVKSLKATLSRLDAAIEGDHGLKEVSRLGHSLKGLLLNMGEREWADLARLIEQSAAVGEQRDYRDILRGIGQGAEKLLSGKKLL
tara:strand:- start:329 stop:724 length:396 start_codon:yes stop_codon:yes gene_type:complete